MGDNQHYKNLNVLTYVFPQNSEFYNDFFLQTLPAFFKSMSCTEIIKFQRVLSYLLQKHSKKYLSVMIIQTKGIDLSECKVHMKFIAILGVIKKQRPKL